ncbi:membrane hypothetical protein [Acinetobacter proteolyticus]|uniref:Uncharacterized protein n=2 Tax=Acinetobacter proteolyticus TaxID=1776741 RepID=A0A653K4T2_9GAMM|nr:membrane hypothetical protein [Acinetobacter proteolyticus]
MKLIYIFIIVWFFYINGWAPLIDSILASVGSSLDFVLYFLLGILAIFYIYCLFGLKIIKVDQPNLYKTIVFINTFLIGSVLSYAILVFVYVKENFKVSDQIFTYSVEDIKKISLPFIIQSPKQLLSTRGEFLKTKLDTYDEYEIFKVKQLGGGYQTSSEEMVNAYPDYEMTREEYEAEEQEERYQDALLMDGGNYDSDPGVHEVSSYSRADGTYVEGYERTNPDGIEENNFSYRGR